jgi:hypothetical protein
MQTDLFFFFLSLSLSKDEYGRPFIVIREQAQKQRIRGLEAQKVRQEKITKSSAGHVTKETHTMSFFAFTRIMCICAQIISQTMTRFILLFFF